MGRRRLEAIPGSVPFLLAPAPGCRFAPRCPHARAQCTESTPLLREVSPGHRVACIL
ncbi:MAG: ABC transporter ATP-binding protein, partial [Burkholderiaceae bacterium]|nr:ABC transporter ATP-binding protein [Burkholderiaceae bacterium]